MQLLNPMMREFSFFFRLQDSLRPTYIVMGVDFYGGIEQYRKDFPLSNGK
jgi:hypothetical protein